MADDLPVSTPCHMPCSSTASSSTQATAMASQPSSSCEVLLRRPNSSVLWYKQSSTRLLHMSFQTVQQLTKARRDSKTEATEEEVHSYLVPREGTLVALFFRG